MHRYQLLFYLAILLIIVCACITYFIYYIPARVSMLYGAPANHLSISDRIEYASRLLIHGDTLTTPLDINGAEQKFFIAPAESISSIANRLQESNLISNADAFFDYVVYTGIDITIQAGEFNLSPKQSIIDIAQSLQKFSPSDATLVILAGWRMEEIAASLLTSGLVIDSDAFILSASNPPDVFRFCITYKHGRFFLS
ncbi:MAG: aminodeoxychorismate lyase [Chloroflexi bacterium OLB14]|nr:MAG: aminodeoxychorismate lyase [Chloroflexi bacterium OLB14]